MKASKSVLLAFALISVFVLSTITLALPASAQSTSAQTVVISNESPGNAITALVNAGYGDLNPYETLQQIVENSNPSCASIITPSFLKALHDCPASSPIFTIHLKDYSSPTAIAISTDGTVWSTAYTGTHYYNTRGTKSLETQVSGVGNFRVVYNSSQSLITSFFTSSGTTYNIFAFLYVPSTALSTGNPTSAPTPTPSAPEFPPIAIVPLALVLLFAAVIVKQKKPKQNCEETVECVDLHKLTDRICSLVQGVGFEPTNAYAIGS